MLLTKSDIWTPALLVDLDLFERNVRTMQNTVRESGKLLRPHAKAHKCVEIARRQLAAGAVGVCAATISELSLMCGAGIGVLLTTAVASKAKTDRVAALVRGGADVRVVVDHPLQVELYQASAGGAGCVIQTLVDLDVGDHRTGIPCDERAIALAKNVSACRNLEFAGLQAYSVSGSHTDGHEARRTHSVNAISKALPIRRELQQLGLNVSTLTGGSTGTWDIDTAIPEMTEIQAGSYPLMDVAYRRIGGIPFEPAMTVLTTVVSANHTNHVTVDAGFKALATDRPFGPEVVGLRDAVWRWGGDEHGLIEFEGAGRKLRPGDRLELLAPHCDPTVNLYDRIYACRDNNVEAVWPLKHATLENTEAEFI